MGVVIVSGLARGLDAAASIEALRYNRYSIGILGCAIDNVYPKENKILYDAIEKTGTIISEYPPGSNPGMDIRRSMISIDFMLRPCLIHNA